MADPKPASPAVSPAVQQAAHDAANRLHHLSMRYGAAIAEIAQGRPLGLIPKGYPGLSDVRDLVDIALLVRAEVSGLTALLIEARRSCANSRRNTIGSPSRRPSNSESR